jgi:hypothetical protein
MVDHRAFTLAFQQLCHAFGKTADLQTLCQYYKAFEDLTEPQVNQLFRWTIDNIDNVFPRIATLKQYATAQEWYTRTPSRRDELVPVVCEQCGGSFVVRRSQLEQDASAGLVYRCVNYTFWHCPIIFYAKAILNQEGD